MQQFIFFQFEFVMFCWLGYFGMFGFLVFVVLFYWEWVWMLDIVFQIFLMINDGMVQVMVNWFGLALVQLLLLSVIKLGVLVEVIFFLYFIFFLLLFLGFYIIMVWVFCNDFLGWAIVLFYIFIVYDVFYWAIFE